MNEISKTIGEVNRKGSGAFIPYLMAGDPTTEKSIEYALALAEGGADLIELGVPFSDPVADGPTIQAAGIRALKTTDSVDKVLKIVREVRNAVKIPIILMSYYNPILQFGETSLLKACQETGTNGIIIPDLPPEEGEEFIKAALERSIGVPLLATPSTDDTRLKEISERSTGFLYLVSHPGTTGSKTRVGEMTTRAIERVKPEVPEELPVCVGFGLSSPEQVGKVIEAGANGAIVGSAIVDLVGENKKPEEIERCVRKLKKATIIS